MACFNAHLTAPITENMLILIHCAKCIPDIFLESKLLDVTISWLEPSSPASSIAMQLATGILGACLRNVSHWPELLIQHYLYDSLMPTCRWSSPSRETDVNFRLVSGILTVFQLDRSRNPPELCRFSREVCNKSSQDLCRIVENGLAHRQSTGTAGTVGGNLLDSPPFPSLIRFLPNVMALTDIRVLVVEHLEEWIAESASFNGGRGLKEVLFALVAATTTTEDEDLLVVESFCRVRPNVIHAKIFYSSLELLLKNHSDYLWYVCRQSFLTCFYDTGSAQTTAADNHLKAIVSLCLSARGPAAVVQVLGAVFWEFCKDEETSPQLAVDNGVSLLWRVLPPTLLEPLLRSLWEHQRKETEAAGGRKENERMVAAALITLTTGAWETISQSASLPEGGGNYLWDDILRWWSKLPVPVTRRIEYLGQLCQVPPENLRQVTGLEKIPVSLFSASSQHAAPSIAAISLLLQQQLQAPGLSQEYLHLLWLCIALCCWRHLMHVAGNKNQKEKEKEMNHDSGSPKKMETEELNSSGQLCETICQQWRQCQEQVISRFPSAQPLLGLTSMIHALLALCSAHWQAYIFPKDIVSSIWLIRWSLSWNVALPLQSVTWWTNEQYDSLPEALALAESAIIMPLRPLAEQMCRELHRAQVSFGHIVQEVLVHGARGYPLWAKPIAADPTSALWQQLGPLARFTAILIYTWHEGVPIWFHTLPLDQSVRTFVTEQLSSGDSRTRQTIQRLLAAHGKHSVTVSQVGGRGKEEREEEKGKDTSTNTNTISIAWMDALQQVVEGDLKGPLLAMAQSENSWDILRDLLLWSGSAAGRSLPTLGLEVIQTILSRSNVRRLIVTDRKVCDTIEALLLLPANTAVLDYRWVRSASWWLGELDMRNGFWSAQANGIVAILEKEGAALKELLALPDGPQLQSRWFSSRQDRLQQLARVMTLSLGAEAEIPTQRDAANSGVSNGHWMPPSVDHLNQWLQTALPGRRVTDAFSAWSPTAHIRLPLTQTAQTAQIQSETRKDLSLPAPAPENSGHGSLGSLGSQLPTMAEREHALREMEAIQFPRQTLELLPERNASSVVRAARTAKRAKAAQLRWASVSSTQSTLSLTQQQRLLQAGPLLSSPLASQRSRAYGILKEAKGTMLERNLALWLVDQWRQATTLGTHTIRADALKHAKWIAELCPAAMEDAVVALFTAGVAVDDIWECLKEFVMF
jgi:hypothetical protein